MISLLVITSFTKSLTVTGLATSQIIIPSAGTFDYSNTSISWLHTSGIYIYDSSNQRIKLYAPNVEYGGGGGFTLADVQAIKSLGFNAFRFAIYWGAVQPYNSSMQGIDTICFTSGKPPLSGCGIDDVVNWAVQENMYIIFRFQWTPAWRPPTWAFPGVADDVQMYEMLFNGTATKEKAGVMNAWKFIANRYASVPNVIFEILNEPGVNNHSLSGSAYANWNTQVISSIESVETQSHLKIVELLRDGDSGWEIIDSSVSDISKTNLLWAIHEYSPMSNYNPTGSYYHGDFTWNGQHFSQGWGNGTVYVAWKIIISAEMVHDWNKPWIITEWGKVVTETYWTSWFRTVLETMTNYNVAGWVIHEYVGNPNNSEWDWNINNPTTQQEIMNLVHAYMMQT